MAFTLGAGTDLVTRAIEHLAKPLVGRHIEDVMAHFGDTFRELAEHPALRWLGPHCGVVHLALAAVSHHVRNSRCTCVSLAVSFWFFTSPAQVRLFLSCLVSAI